MSDNGNGRRVDPASLEAYHQMVISGKARTQRERIFACAVEHQVPINNRQLSKLTGIPINAVTARVRVLLDSGLMQEAGRGDDPQTGATGVRYIEPVPYVGKVRQIKMEL